MCFNSVVKWDTPKLELQIGWMKWAHVTTIVLYRKIFENILSENFSWRSWVFSKTLLSWEITHDKQSSIHDLYCVSKQFKDCMGRLYKRSYSRGCGNLVKSNMENTPWFVLDVINISRTWNILRRVSKQAESWMYLLARI